MAIQPQIAMGFQMPQIQLPNQGNMLMQVAQLQQMQEANALRQAQARKLQLDEEQENALARLMQSGGDATLSQFVGAGGFSRGSKAFELSQAQRGAQQKETAGRQLTTAQVIAALRGDLSDEALGYASQMLAQQGQRDPFIAELMLTPREDRQLLASRLMNAVPGMEAVRLATRKADLGIGETEAKIAKTQALTDVERARLAGTLPRGEQQRLAPSIQIIADPTDPSKQLLVDATIYQPGGGLKSPGVLGRPGITREPAPVLTTIQDPNDPTQTIVVNARAFPGQRDGASPPGMVGVAGAQATVSREGVKKELAQAQLNDTLDNISGLYNELNRLKGLTSTERSALTNVPARIAGSAVGQMVGQAVGTTEQSIRDQISAARFILVQQIKTATGMSAQQLNSNFELQAALNSLSDPTQGYEAAINIIEKLRKTYGLGGAPAVAPPSRGSVGAEAPTSAGRQTALPMPTKKEDAVAGQVYQTSRGPARWDGKQFIPVSE